MDNNYIELGWTKEIVEDQNNNENEGLNDNTQDLNSLGSQEKRMYLLESIAEKNIEKLKNIIDAGVDLKFKVSKKMKLSTYALKFFNEEICEYLSKKISFKDKAEGLSVILENDDVDAFKWFMKYNKIDEKIIMDGYNYFNMNFNIIEYFHENNKKEFDKLMECINKNCYSVNFLTKLSSRADKYNYVKNFNVPVLRNECINNLNDLKKHLQFIKDGHLAGFNIDEISKYTLSPIKLKRKDQVNSKKLNFAKKIIISNGFNTSNLIKEIVNKTDFLDNLIKEDSLENDTVMHFLIGGNFLENKLSLLKNYKDGDGNNIAHLLFIYNKMNVKTFNQLFKIDEELLIARNNDNKSPLNYSENKIDVYEKLLLQKSIKDTVKENKNLKTNTKTKRKM